MVGIKLRQPHRRHAPWIEDHNKFTSAPRVMHPCQPLMEFFLAMPGPGVGGPQYNSEAAIMGVLGRSPQRGPGAEHLVKGAKKAKLKLKHFGFWAFNESRKFAHFLEILKRKKIKYNSCCLCKK